MIEINNICIIGAGNVGVTLAVDIANATNKNIILHTSKASSLDTFFSKTDTDTGITTNAKINVTNNYEKSLQNADLVIITVPTFLTKTVIEKVSCYEPKMVLFVPGFGGKEFYCKKLIEKNCIIAGLARSPYVCRLTDFQHVNASKKKELHFAILNSKENYEKLLSEIFSMTLKQYKNYLVVTFTPSNPILHTARLYSLFKDSTFETPFSKIIKFYGEWNNFASEILFKMDSELSKICEKLKKIDLSEHVPLDAYYESKTIKELTKKITTIKSWHDLDSPMIKKDDYFYADKNSRYFTEDFSFGLCVLKGFAILLDVKTPQMDEVLKWYQVISGFEFFDKNGNFEGSDLENTSIPQNFGIKNKEDIEKFYL